MSSNNGNRPVSANLNDLYKGFHDRLKDRDQVPSNKGRELCLATRQAAETLDIASVTPIANVRLWLMWALLQRKIDVSKLVKDYKAAKDALASKETEIQRLKHENESLKLELNQKKTIDNIDTVVRFIKEEVVTKKVAKEFVWRVGFVADVVSSYHIAVFVLCVYCCCMLCLISYAISVVCLFLHPTASFLFY